MKTTVVNLKRREPFDMYIGRPCRRARDPRARAGSVWANPFNISGPGGCGTVEEALERYESHIRRRVALDADFRDTLLALEGLRLGCWCKPDPCHGDVLVKLIDEIKEGRL